MANEMTIFAKLSAKLYLNVKVRSFAAEHPQAAFLWVLAITYSVDRKSDGFVEEFAMRSFLGGQEEDIQALVDAGFLEPADGGWNIHDYLDSQVSAEEQDSIRSKRSAAGRKGGLKSRAASAKPSSDDVAHETTDEHEHSGDEAKRKQVLKQTRSKTEANAQANEKQTRSKTEAEIEIEIDNPPIVPPRGTGGETEQAPDSGSDADGFDAAWRTYPKHTGSQAKTRRAWVDALAEADAARLMEAVEAYAAHVEADPDDARWTPTMANWLERGQWRDWLPKPKPVRTPDQAWYAEHFDRRLLDAGIDYLEVMRLHPKVNARIRDGDTWRRAADLIGEQALEAHKAGRG